MADTTDLCSTCGGTGEVCMRCGLNKKQCECRVNSPVVCDDCAGVGAFDKKEEDAPSE